MIDGSQKRLGSNLYDEELLDIKNSVKANAVVWGYFLEFAVVGLPEWGSELREYLKVAKGVRPDANDFALAVAAGDLRDDACRERGWDPKSAMLELLDIEKAEINAGRALPKEQDKRALAQLYEKKRNR